MSRSNDAVRDALAVITKHYGNNLQAFFDDVFSQKLKNKPLVDLEAMRRSQAAQDAGNKATSAIASQMGQI